MVLVLVLVLVLALVLVDGCSGYGDFGGVGGFALGWWGVGVCFAWISHCSGDFTRTEDTGLKDTNSFREIFAFVGSCGHLPLFG